MKYYSNYIDYDQFIVDVRYQIFPTIEGSYEFYSRIKSWNIVGALAIL